MNESTKKIIAHRGAWKDFNFPQNSVAAFLKAQELPIGGIEFDLQFTKDKRVIVHHDDDFKGNLISQKRYIQMKGYQYFGGEEILSFKKILHFWEGEKTLWIELKPSNLNGIQKKEFVAKVLKILEGKTSNIQFISFDLTILKLIRKSSDFPCSFLGEEYSVTKLHENEIYGVDAEYPRYFNEPNLLSGIKANKMKSNAWTVNNPVDAWKLIQKGVDYITTDEVVKTIEKFKSEL